MRRVLGGLIACAIALASARAGAVPTGSEELESALRLSGNMDRGAALFETCAACHGPEGHGAVDGSVPAIAAQPVSVILTQLIAFRYDVRPDVRMEHFADARHLQGPQQLADVAAFIHALPAAAVPGAQSSTQGAQLYASLCSSCHGATAEGNGPSRVPRLAGQHPEYLAEQLSNAREGRRPSMARDHAALASRLNPEETAAVAGYLAALPAGTQRPAPADR